MDNILIISDFPDVQYKKESGTPAFRLIVEALSKKYIVHIVAQDGIAQSENNIIYHRISYYDFLPNSIRLFRVINAKLFWFDFTYRSFNLACKLHIQYDFKLVCGMGCKSVYTAAKVGYKLNIPSIGRLFGTYLYPFLNNSLSLLLRFDESIAFKSNCTKFLITNDGTAGDEVAEHFGIPKEKLCFWRNGVECPPECLLTSSDKIRIISLARLQDWKRIDRIITAFTHASLKNSKIVLDIVGGGLEEDNLKSLVKKYDDLYYDIGYKIIFHGEILRERALVLLGCSDIFISTNDYSNVSNSLMEAMYGGKGIIVLNTGKTSDVIDGTNGLLVDESELSDAIIQLCDKDTRELFGYKAHQYAIDHFESWESRINREVVLYEDLIYKGEIK